MKNRITMSCLKCNKATNATKDFKCDRCGRPIHGTCANLTRAEEAQMRLTNRRLKFFCEDCDSSVIHSTNQSDVDEMKNILVDLRKEISSLREEIATMKGGTSINNNEELMEDIISEMREREKCSKNLILHGLEELKSDNLNDRREHDKIKATEVVQSLSQNIDLSRSVFIRLGKSGTTAKPRPLKVTLKNEAAALSVLKNTKTLKNRNDINITRDRTQKERDYLKKLRMKLDQLNKDGNNGYTIRYVQNTPKIVENTPKNTI